MDLYKIIFLFFQFDIILCNVTNLSSFTTHAFNAQCIIYFLTHNVFTLVLIRMYVPFKELNTKSKTFAQIFLSNILQKKTKSVFLVQVNKFIYQFRFWSNVHEATASTYICQINDVLIF